MIPILPYVYKCTNHITGEYYIGYRYANKINAQHDIGRVYFSSSKFVKANKHLFKFQVLAEFFDKADAHIYEQTLICDHISDPLCLNKNIGGNPITGDYRWFTDGTLNIYTLPGYEPPGWEPGRSGVQGKSRPGPMSPMFGLKGPNNPNYGKKRTEEFKKRNSEIHKHKITSEETKQKISEANKGKSGLTGDKNPAKRDDVRNKIRQARIGKRASDETREKMRLSKLGKKRGKYKTKSKDSGECV